MSPRISRIAVCLASALSLATPPALAAEGPRLVMEPVSGQGSPFRPAFPALPWRPAAWPRASAPLAAARDCSAFENDGLSCSRISLATGALGSDNVGQAPGPAATRTVTSCNDSHTPAPGELRYEVAHAANGDTIDMTELKCSPIILYNGAIAVTQNTLTLQGPGRNKLGITGAYAYHAYEKDRILNHTGTGKLTIENLYVAYGRLNVTSGLAEGGCINSVGSVYLYHVGVYNCRAYSGPNGRGTAGGGVHAHGGLTLKYSVISGNSIFSGNAFSNNNGGGVYVFGHFLSKYSTISNNAATGKFAAGGGVFAYNNTTIFGSTISGNVTTGVGGGIQEDGFNPLLNYTVAVVNSTISGNNAYLSGGMLVQAGKVNIYNSSIIFNTATTGAVPTNHFRFAPGVAIDATPNQPDAVTLQSSLIANNTTAGGQEYDLSVPDRANTKVTFSGANNLVRVTFVAVPADTIQGSCPRLGPLRNNGGPTATHALLSRSPGIDQGNNAARQNNDQRGPGYARVSGVAADIGAYEVQQNDIIFNAGFDGCP